MRINKYLALSGVGSRRGVEEIINDKRVKVNGVLVTNLATDIKEDDVVTVDGRSVLPDESFVYLMLYKPKGYVTTAKDEHGRKTVLDLIPKEFKDKRLYPVGRLDYDTVGLLILTNDGALTQKLTHPSSNVVKVYEAKLARAITKGDLDKIKKGVKYKEEVYAPCEAELVKNNEGEWRVRVSITEGKNHQVKNMFLAVGHEVVFLKRTQIGKLILSGLDRGECRLLSGREVKLLKG